MPPELKEIPNLQNGRITRLQNAIGTWYSAEKRVNASLQRQSRWRSRHSSGSRREPECPYVGQRKRPSNASERSRALTAFETGKHYQFGLKVSRAIRECQAAGELSTHEGLFTNHLADPWGALAPPADDWQATRDSTCLHGQNLPRRCPLSAQAGGRCPSVAQCCILVYRLLAAKNFGWQAPAVGQFAGCHLSEDGYASNAR